MGYKKERNQDQKKKKNLTTLKFKNTYKSDSNNKYRLKSI